MGEPWFTIQGVRNSLHTRFEIPALTRLLRLPTNCDVLETGCRVGLGLMTLAKTCKPASLTGVDIDRDALRQARRRCSARRVAVTLVHADIRQLPFDDESFDLVVDFGTLYRVEPTSEALSEIARVLRFSGALVHETSMSQWLAHPTSSARRVLPWHLAPQLVAARSGGLWARRVKRTRPIEQRCPS